MFVVSYIRFKDGNDFSYKQMYFRSLSSQISILEQEHPIAEVLRRLFKEDLSHPRFKTLGYNVIDILCKFGDSATLLTWINRAPQFCVNGYALALSRFLLDGDLEGLTQLNKISASREL